MDETDEIATKEMNSLRSSNSRRRLRDRLFSSALPECERPFCRKYNFAVVSPERGILAVNLLVV